MKKTIFVLLMVLFAALSLHGSALSEDHPTKSASLRTRDDAALALIAFPWRDLKYDVVFLPPKAGYRAMIFSDKHRIEVYARPDDSASQIAYDIAHELGHAIDLSYNTEETRRQWMAARGIEPSTPWFGCNRCSDYQTPAGDFAETFALLLLGPGHFSGRIAPPPAAGQVSRLRSFFPNLLAH